MLLGIPWRMMSMQLTWGGTPVRARVHDSSNGWKAVFVKCTGGAMLRVILPRKCLAAGIAKGTLKIYESHSIDESVR